MKMKEKYKPGFFYGLVIAIYIIAKNLLTDSDLSVKKILIILATGIVGGALSGLLFGWLMRLFANSKMLTKSTKIDIQEGETIVFDTGANHFKGIEAVGGKLFLTNKRLVFKSHKFNFQPHELSISLNEIDNVCRCKTAGIVDNGLCLTTTGNKTEKFVVEQAEEWITQLNKKTTL